MTPLVITEAALNALAGYSVNPLVFDQVEGGHLGAIIFRPGQAGMYLFTKTCTAKSRLLVIRRWSDGLFKTVEMEERRQVFDRCKRIALESFDQNVTLNPRWSPFHEGNRVSLFAYGYGGGHLERIVAEVNVRGLGSVYVYDFGVGPRIQNLKENTPLYDIFEKAVEKFPSILKEAETLDHKEIGGSIDLEQLAPGSISKGYVYDNWYPRLSLKQKEFLDRELTGPLRLRGAAGTGKTLAMALKALKVKYDAEKAGTKRRILFITHSWAMAEYVDTLINQLDHGCDAEQILVYPLLTVIQTKDYKKIGRQPLGLDSEEGKRKTLAEISEVLDLFVASDWVAYKSAASPELATQIEAGANSAERRGFCWDLMIEFGCVLAAQGILTHDGDKEKYFKSKRLKWMMSLPRNEDKEVIFALWKMFLKQLRDKGLITSDQIVADVLNELSTFYWEAARTKNGYDVVFVDEMHLFNAQERLVFHHLLNDGDKPPLVVMALDPKQSPREVFTSLADDREHISVYDRARLPNSDKIDLIEIFRYTPEIAKLVLDILNAVPGLDIVEDWDVPAGASATEGGPTPEFKLVANAVETLKDAVNIAKKVTDEARAHRGRVAILCLDDERFSAYLPAVAGRFPNEVLIVASRDDTDTLQYANRKIVFSTPEYVAGLQFDTVILVDANRDLVPAAKYKGHQLRRFMAELYLGISRAERRLIILASRDAGGLSQYLEQPIKDGHLKEMKTSAV